MTLASSRPLRFLALLIGGWIALRTIVLWPGAGPLPALTSAFAPPVAVAPMQSKALASRSRVRIRASPAPAPPPRTATIRHESPIQRPERDRELIAVAAPLSVESVKTLPASIPTAVAGPGRAQPVFPPTSRLAGSGWLIARSGGEAIAFTPQLGGSQAGVRLTYALGDARRFALSVRFSSALGSRQREAGLGIDWQPTALPVHVIAEQRIGIAQARGGPALGLIAGLNPTRVVGDVQVEAYAQAGGIARGGIEGFADGAVRLTRPVAARGPVTFDLGVGAWGGAQRGAARFDIGPAARAALPAAGRTVRFALEWRQRIAGRARPGSGPALSIGTDF